MWSATLCALNKLYLWGMIRVLVVDHHDSFVYNLVQIVREAPDCTYKVVAIEEVEHLSEPLSDYTHILLSPGPGHPDEYPALARLIHRCKHSHTILGVCLGFQAIALAFGGVLEQLSSPKHGHASCLVEFRGEARLLEGLIRPIVVGRYHSWGVPLNGLPDSLCLDATYEDDPNQVAVFSHKELPIYGVQFHPESVLTPQGVSMVRHWLYLPR